MTDQQAKRKSIALLRRKQRQAEIKSHTDLLTAIGALATVIDFTAEVPEELRLPMDIVFNAGSRFIRRI